MAVLSISGVGKSGLYKDSDYLNAPDDSWSEAINVRFESGIAEKIKGYEDAFSASGIPEIAPYFTYSIIPASGDNLFVYAGLNKVYATNGPTSANITRQSGGLDVNYSAGIDTNWTATVLSGLLILNNSIDPPQQWVLANHLTNRLSNLGNWPTGMLVKSIVSYKNFLIAANIDEATGTFNPNLIRWSAPAEPGFIPSSWDYTDPTVLAGRVEQAAEASQIIGMANLRDSNIIYKEHSIIAMNYIGGNSIFAFQELFRGIGLLGPRCVIPFFGKHLIFGDGDVVVHDGQNIESPMDRKMVKYIFSNMDGDKRNRSFVVVDYNNKEVWLCYSTGQTVPDTAVRWSYRDNTVCVSELNAAAHIDIGEVSEDLLTMDGALGTFEAQTKTFDELLSKAFQKRLVLANPIDQKLYVMNETAQFDGVNIQTSLVRLVVPFRDAGGNIDVMSTKFVREVYLNANGTFGGILKVWVGGRFGLDDPVSYQGPFPFQIGSSRKINCRVSGRIIDFRITSDSEINWRLYGYTFVYEIAGLR